MDGKFAQAFGELRHAPARIDGTFGASMQLKYGGYSDFLSNDERRGELDLYSALRHPLLPKGCTLDAPLHSVVKDDPAVPFEMISKNPQTVKFGVVDTQLAPAPCPPAAFSPLNAVLARATTALRGLNAVGAYFFLVTQMVMVAVTTGLPFVSVIVTGTGSSNPSSPNSGSSGSSATARRPVSAFDT